MRYIYRAVQDASIHTMADGLMGFGMGFKTHGFKAEVSSSNPQHPADGTVIGA